MSNYLGIRAQWLWCLVVMDVNMLPLAAKKSAYDFIDIIRDPTNFFLY